VDDTGVEAVLWVFDQRVVTPAQSGVCSTSSKNTFRVNGGNGYRFTVVRTEAWFNCPPGLNLATRQNWSCNTHGNCAREWDNDWAWWE
jgi:hypothetical protein